MRENCKHTRVIKTFDLIDYPVLIGNSMTRLQPDEAEVDVACWGIRDNVNLTVRGNIIKRDGTLGKARYSLMFNDRTDHSFGGIPEEYKPLVDQVVQSLKLALVVS